jgi:hypothetical protein
MKLTSTKSKQAMVCFMAACRTSILPKSGKPIAADEPLCITVRSPVVPSIVPKSHVGVLCIIPSLHVERAQADARKKFQISLQTATAFVENAP